MFSKTFRIWDGYRYFYDVLSWNNYDVIGNIISSESSRDCTKVTLDNMEFSTGIECSNGDCLFEGDIIQLKHSGFIGVVTYQQGEFDLLDNKGKTIPVTAAGPDSDYYCIGFVKKENLILLGNIRQNINLLKDNGKY